MNSPQGINLTTVHNFSSVSVSYPIWIGGESLYCKSRVRSELSPGVVPCNNLHKHLHFTKHVLSFSKALPVKQPLCLGFNKSHKVAKASVLHL